MKIKILIFSFFLIFLSLSDSTIIKADDIFPPFYSREVITENNITIEKISLRPFFTVYRTLNKDNVFVFEQLQLLWPFIFYQKTNERRFFRFYPLVFVTSQFREDGTDFDTFLLPFISWGNDPKEGKYFNFLPFGGIDKGHLGKDRIICFMVPLYFRTEYKGWKSTNYLFPFFQTNTGSRHAGWRFWPLYGTYRIYADDQNTQLLEDRKFILWPFWIKQNRYLHDGLVGKTFLSLPFYGSYESPSKVQKMYCWPIYNKTSYPKEGAVSYNILWPFFRYGKGPKAKQYEFWPLYGYKQNAGHTRQYFIWPLTRVETDHNEKENASRFWLLPFFWTTHIKNIKENTESRKVKFWPVCQYAKTHEDVRKFEVLSPFWFNDSAKGGFENNYADFFRLFHTKYKKKEWYDTRFLFNLIQFQKDKESRKIRVFPFIYSYEKSPIKKKVSILGGLIEYKKTEVGKSFKILWIPFSRKHRSKT